VFRVIIVIVAIVEGLCAYRHMNYNLWKRVTNNLL